MKLLEIKGVDVTIRALRKLQGKGKRMENASVVVGYTQNYAIEVHENMEMRHAPGTQAKFLEQPARQLGHEIGSLITETYKKTQDLEQSMMFGGLRLQRASQEIVPVDTGALRASAFTALERNVNQAANAALSRSNALKASKPIKRNIRKRSSL